MTGEHSPEDTSSAAGEGDGPVGHGGGRLIGVGVGPGEPDLLTLRALERLRSADRVVAPVVSPEVPGRAEQIVRRADASIEIERLVFDMGPDRTASHAGAAERLIEPLHAGETVAFVTLGDPNVYSTFSALAHHVRQLLPGVEIETVPGIMAFQELVARTGVVLLDGTESLRLVTALDGPAAVAEAAQDLDAAIVVYKGGRHLGEIAEALELAGRSEGSVFGELLGLPDERVGMLSRETGEASYLATVVVPPKRRG